MGDLLIKQKSRSSPQWQPMEYRRPWPPMYRSPIQKPHQHQQFNFHPNPIEPKNWHNHSYNFSPSNIYQTNKSRDYYFLAPLYRNAMPPPPKPQKERFLLENKKRPSKRITEQVCHCRSRSMDDVRFDVVELTPDENGNNLEKSKTKGIKSAFGKHSMEDLLADTMYTSGPKRIGPCQVDILFINH